MSQTRNKNKKFGFDFGITEDDKHILGNKLPTKEQVLRCFLYYFKDGNGDDKQKSALKVYEQVLPHYEKGGVLIKSDRTCKKNILTLYERYEKIRKIPKDRRDTDYGLNKLREFQDDLHYTMPLWHENALNECNNEEDKEFLLSMMGKHPKLKYREASYTSKDVKTAQRFAKYEARKLKEKQYSQKHQNKNIQDKVSDSDIDYSDIVVSSIINLQSYT